MQHGANDTVLNEDDGNILTSAARKGDISMVDCLLRHGANVNVVAGVDGTALATAARNGHYEVVTLLLQHMANVNVVAGEYGTPLGAAVSAMDFEMANLLLEHGADINQSSPAGVHFAFAAARSRMRSRDNTWEHVPLSSSLMGKFVLQNGASEYKRPDFLIGKKL